MTEARAGSRWTGRASVRAGWLIWLAFAVGIVGAYLNRPDRTVTTSYREAAIAFVNSRPMYTEGKMGWLYPVQSAMVFVPFSFEPRSLAEALWRVLGAGALAVAVWRFTRVCRPMPPAPGMPARDLFFLVTAAAMPPALSAGRNGQTNLLLAALFILACTEVIQRRWWLATLWLCVALAAKPIAIVPLLLMTALHVPLWRRMPVGLAIVGALPFLHPDWGYVIQQYSAGIRKVVEAGDIRDFTEFHPADLTSLLDLVGIPPGGAWLTALRAGAALLTLLVAWRALRIFDWTTAAVIALALSCGYLMVFNPRTEGNTYVIFGPPLGMLAAWSVLQGRRSVRSILLVTACVLLGGAQLLVYRQREYWIRPAETLLLLAWLSAAVVVPRWRRSIPALPAPAISPGNPA